MPGYYIFTYLSSFFCVCMLTFFLLILFSVNSVHRSSLRLRVSVQHSQM